MNMVSVEEQLQTTSLKSALSYWLATWRSLNEDCTRLQMTAMKYQQLIELAAKQIQSYENIFKESEFFNERLFHRIKNAKVKDFLMNKKLREIIDGIIILKKELCLNNEMLENQILKLKCSKKKLFTLTTKSASITESLQESQVINKNLRERNRTLQAEKREAMELYRSRDLMFVYQLIDKTQELKSAQDKAKAITYASSSLQANIDQIQLQEKKLIRQLATERVKRIENSQSLDIVRQYMRFLWECVASLAFCSKLQSPEISFNLFNFNLPL